MTSSCPLVGGAGERAGLVLIARQYSPTGVHVRLLLRALEVYETDRLDFAEAYLVAQAERSGIGVIASFDRAIDRVTTVRRLEPA